jgi:hypothetical protein
VCVQLLSTLLTHDLHWLVQTSSVGFQENRIYYFDVPELVQNDMLTIRVQTTTGAVGLFARFGSKPTYFNEDASSKETAPGTCLWHKLRNAYWISQLTALRR